MPEVLQIIRFRLLAGRSREYLALSARIYEEFLLRRPGFIGREVLQAEDGTWHEAVRWADPPSSDDADRIWASHPLAAELGSLLQRGSLDITRLLSLRYDPGYEPEG